MDEAVAQRAPQPKDPSTGRFVKSDPDPIPVPAEPATATPAHPSWLVTSAKEHLGLDDAEIAAIPIGTLAKMVNAGMARDIQQRQQQAAHHQFVNPQQQQPAPPPDELEGWDWGKGEDGKALSEGDYAPIIPSGFRRQQKEINELKAELQASRQREAARMVHDGATAIDEGFEALDDFKHIFGEGSAQDLLAAKDDALARRVAVLNEAKINIYQPPPRKQLIKVLKEASERMFGFGKKKAAPNPYDQPEPQPAVAEEEWANGAVERPTHRRAAQLPAGREKAIRNMQRKMDEAKQREGGEDQETLGTFLE
jgi:hypothetical protein